jgi:hypothetical protein
MTEPLGDALLRCRPSTPLRMTTRSLRMTTHSLSTTTLSLRLTTRALRTGSVEG